MEHDDETWATLVGAFDHLEPPDALLDALLDDVALSVTRFSASAATEDALAGRRESDGPTRSASIDASPQVPIIQVTDVVPLTKRKRIRHSRPVHEVQRLRHTVTDLENLIALHNKRLLNSRLNRIDAPDSSTTGDANVPGIWQGVAARQYKFLRDAQLENQKLRHQVRAQLAIGKNLIRLIQRAGNDAPMQLIHRSLVEGDAGIVTHKRQSLFTIASEMYAVVDSVFALEPFSNDGIREFRETVVSQHKSDSIPLGTLLASTSICRILPRALSGLSELLWNVNQSDQAFHHAYKLEHREESSHSQSFVYSVTILTPYGPVVCHGVGLRVRYCEAHREVVVTTGSMWPDSRTPSPRNAVAYDFKEWVVVKPVPFGGGDGTEQNQVLVRFETTRPSGGEVRSHEQVMVLQHFIAQAHNFIVEQEQRQIDAILLGHASGAGDRAVENVGL